MKPSRGPGFAEEVSAVSPRSRPAAPTVDTGAPAR